MGSKYWITGMQLMMLEANCLEESKKMVGEILDHQYIGNGEIKIQKQIEKQIEKN